MSQANRGYKPETAQSFCRDAPASHTDVRLCDIKNMVVNRKKTVTLPVTQTM
jgi:hypothetical protein